MSARHPKINENMKKILLFAFVSLLLIGCNHATDSVWQENGTKQIKPSQFLYGTRWYNNDYFMD